MFIKLASAFFTQVRESAFRARRESGPPKYPGRRRDKTRRRARRSLLSSGEIVCSYRMSDELCRRSARRLSVPAIANDAVTLAIDLRRRREEIAPNARRRRQRRQGAPKGLDRQPAVIAGAFQCPERRGKIDMSPPGRAAIVLGNVHVRKMTTDCPDRLDGVLFLDIGVKGIVHAGNVRMPDRSR